MEGETDASPIGVPFLKAFWLYGIGLLGAMYGAAFVLVYTPWGRTLNIVVPVEFLYIKIVLVIVGCLWITSRIYKVISLAAETYDGPPLFVRIAKAFIIGITVVLIVITHLVAGIAGVSYRM